MRTRSATSTDALWHLAQSATNYLHNLPLEVFDLIISKVDEYDRDGEQVYTIMTMRQRNKQLLAILTIKKSWWPVVQRQLMSVFIVWKPSKIIPFKALAERLSLYRAVTTLCLTAEFYDSCFSLSRLGQRKPPKDLRALIASCPCFEAVVCFNSGFLLPPTISPFWPNPFPHLRSLRVSELAPVEMNAILKACPKLRQFEIYQEFCTESEVRVYSAGFTDTIKDFGVRYGETELFEQFPRLLHDPNIRLERYSGIISGNIVKHRADIWRGLKHLSMHTSQALVLPSPSELPVLQQLILRGSLQHDALVTSMKKFLGGNTSLGHLRFDHFLYIFCPIFLSTQPQQNAPHFARLFEMALSSSSADLVLKATDYQSTSAIGLTLTFATREWVQGFLDSDTAKREKATEELQSLYTPGSFRMCDHLLPDLDLWVLQFSANIP